MMVNFLVPVFLGPAFLAMVVSYFVSWVVIKKSKVLRIIDDPKKHIHVKNTHQAAVPRGGGLPIFAAVATGAIFLPQNTQTLAIIIGALLLGIVGLLDDVFEEKLSPYLRLLVNLASALCVIGTGIGIAYITNPAGGVIRLDLPQVCFQLFQSQHCIWILSDLFALLWLVWMQNIVGWSSGVDGQLPGFVIVAAIAMAILGMRFPGDFSQITVITLAGLIAGAYAGFLPWNWYPQRMMPGYGGKSLAGFLLGILAIYSGAKVGTMFLVLSIPIIDAVMVIYKRLKEGRSPVWGGREHLHHFLLDKGWSKKGIAKLYLFMSAFFAVIALQLNASLKYFTMATAILVISGTILWLQNWSTSSKQHGQDNG
jgi:UDP-GlcNAc:undecaprenyl-phosphate GlcNAc-1-phosphate transferase